MMNAEYVRQFLNYTNNVHVIRNKKRAKNELLFLLLTMHNYGYFDNKQIQSLYFLKVKIL